VFTLKYKYAALIFFLCTLFALPVRAEEDFLALGKQILIGTDEQRAEAADAIVARGDEHYML